MTAPDDPLYADLPLAQLRADPPVTEKKLLELGVAWRVCRLPGADG